MGKQQVEIEAVAITGLGIVSCLGCTLDAVSAALQRGESGIVADPARRTAGFRSTLTGQIRGFDSDRYCFTRKMLRSMDEPAVYAWAAAHSAIADARLNNAELRDPRCGVIFGNDSTVQACSAAIDVARAHSATHDIGGGQVFKCMNSTITMHLAALLGIQGANWTTSAACASGAHAIGQAAMLIRLGLQDMMLAGAAQETNWQSVAAFDALGAFSLRAATPAEASRPFDAARDGLVPSGGAACVVLERLSRARARGARVYGIMRGYGFSSDGAGHLAQPDGHGARRATEMALRDAGVTPGQIDYVNAHATSTPIGDRIEAETIAAIYGPQVHVSSTKSMTGHECWMSGASEVVYCSLMARDGFVAPNVNFQDFEEGCPRIGVVQKTMRERPRLVASNSFGFGGTNAVLVLDYTP